MTDDRTVLYWDSSAILSMTFNDVHETAAREHFHRPGKHLVSSLARAECSSVIARTVKVGDMAASLGDHAIGSIARTPWVALAGAPTPTTLRTLAHRYPLRGADLWHLAFAVDLAEDLPELRLLTFDSVLDAAARAEGLALD